MKYLPTGEGVEVMEKLKSGFLVQIQAVTVDGEGEEYWVEGPLRIVDQVLDHAPTARIDEEIRRKKKQLADLTDVIAAAQNAKREADKEFDGLKARLKQHEALKHIDDYLAGKLTHFVVIPQYCAAYITDGKVSEDDSRWNRSNLRLLGLFGDTNGDLQWKLNDHRDGSGSYTRVIPCASEEQARQALSAWINQDCERDWECPSRVDTAKKYGIEIRVDHAERAKVYRLKDLEANRKREQESLDRTLAAIAAAKGEQA